MNQFDKYEPVWKILNWFEKYEPVWKIWTSLKKFELEVNLNHNIYNGLNNCKSADSTNK